MNELFIKNSDIFFFYNIFLSPGCEPSLVVSYGVPIWSLLVLYLPLKKYFLISTYKRFFLIFDPFKIFNSGRVDLRVWSSYGVPIWYLSVLHLPLQNFFRVKFISCFFGIFDPEIFSSQENVSVNFFSVSFTAGFCSILTSKIVYPLEGGPVKGLPMGYQFVSLSVLYLPYIGLFFSIPNYERILSCIPWRWPT